MRQIGASLDCIWFLAIAGYGQTFRGAINGTLTHPSWAVVANAHVKASDVATDVSITAVTTSDGAFSYQDLPLGTYKFAVSAPGFQSITVDNVTVTAGSAYPRPVKLAVGSSGTTVEVSAAALTLDATTAAQANVCRPRRCRMSQ